MCSLEKFPHLTQTGQVNVCEVDGKVQSLAYDIVGNVDIYTNTVVLLPRVNIAQEIGAGPSSRNADGPVFLPTDDSLLKQVVSAWHESGTFNALQVACQETDGVLSKCFQAVISAIDYFKRLQHKYSPLLQEKGEDLTAIVAQCRDWSRSPVRYIDWHPQTTKFAVAAFNDSVRVYSVDSSLVPILKCPTQTAVSCLAWRPYSSSEIAVGCEIGVFLWTVDPTSVVARPSMSCAQILKRPGHCPVTSVAWAREGDLMISASASDKAMYVWDPAQERSAPMYKVDGGGVCLATWSLSSERLFAAGSGLVFRVWCTREWVSERWTTPYGRVQSACWSPCGSVLLFATTAEPLVYSLRFDDAGSPFGKDEGRDGKVVIDLTPVEISKDGERGGGLVSSMAWDRRGLHLAIVFKDSNVIAIFKTFLGLTFNIAPCCFVNGLPGETPSTIAFQKNFEEGSMLTIAWSSGRLQHFPIICSDLDMDSKILGQSFKSTQFDQSTSSLRYFN